MGQSASADVFSGVDATGAPVTVVVLTPAGAADPSVRSAFVELAGSSSYAVVAGQVPVHASDLAAARPWAANWQFPGQTGVEEWLTILPAPVGVLAPSPVAFAPQPLRPSEGWGGGASSQVPTAAPPGRRSQSWYVATGVSLLAIVIVAVVAVVLMNRDDSGARGERTPSASATGSASPSASASSSPSQPSAAAKPSLPGSGKPTPRQATARTIVGPSFAEGESTFLMAFNGWPFAFRAPGTWGCLAGNVENIPDAAAWVCVDEQNSGAGQKLNIMLRQCPTTCTPQERSDMNAKWLDAAASAKPVLDDRTWFVETESNSKGKYSLDISRFIPAQQGQAIKWQVGAYVESPGATRGTVQKIINEIVTQTL